MIYSGVEFTLLLPELEPTAVHTQRHFTFTFTHTASLATSSYTIFKETGKLQ
jgi:hypothetical protein